MGIAPNLFNDLREVLLHCGPTARASELAPLFIDTRLQMWADGLPRRDNPAGQVEAVIRYLHNRYDWEQRNALVQLLHVLAERNDPATMCHRRLLQLADRLDAELAPQPGRRLQAPFQVPSESKAFVGRRAEVEMLVAALADRESEQNVYCLRGMAGVGKTALAIHVAHLLRGHFRDGIYWGKGDEDPLLLLDDWAAHLDPDFEDPPDLDSRAAAVWNIMADKDLLVVLDNVADEGQVEQLFAGRPQCPVLLTTQNADLPYILHARDVPLRSLPVVDALDLLAQIVGDEPVELAHEAARAICQAVGSLPLAVTLAAQQLASPRGLRLADMAVRLRDERRRLALRMGNTAVRASLSVSLQSLNDAARRHFALTAVFKGLPFTEGAFATIAGIEDRWVAKEVLYHLVVLSLLEQEEDLRYGQHRLLADLADEELENLGEREEAQRALVNHYRALARAHAADFLRLEAVWDNIRLALELAAGLQMWEEVLALVDALEETWFRRGHYQDARAGFRSGRQAAEALADEARLAHCLLGEGRATLEQNDYEQAESLLERSKGHFAKLGRGREVAQVNYYLGQSALEQADFARARTLFGRAMAVWEKEADVAKQGATLYQLAFLDLEQDRLGPARHRAREALSLQRSAGHEIGVMRTLVTLAEATKKENLAEAIGYCEEALAVGDRVHHRQYRGEALYTLCKLLTSAGRLREARERGEEGLRLFRHCGSERSEAQTLYLLSRIYQAEGNLVEACERGESSLAMCRRLEDEWGAVWILDHLATVREEMEQPAAARALLEEALALGEPLNHALSQQIRQRLEEITGAPP